MGVQIPSGGPKNKKHPLRCFLFFIYKENEGILSRPLRKQSGGLFLGRSVDDIIIENKPLYTRQRVKE